MAAFYIFCQYGPVIDVQLGDYYIFDQILVYQYCNNIVGP